MSNIINAQGMNPKFIEISKRYGLNPVFLQSIMPLEQKGYSNLEIANMTGISRTTVNTYVQVIKKMKSEDFWELVAIVAIAVAGVAIISELLKKK